MVVTFKLRHHTEMEARGGSLGDGGGWMQEDEFNPKRQITRSSLCRCPWSSRHDGPHTRKESVTRCPWGARRPGQAEAAVRTCMQPPWGQRRREMPQFKREFQFYISVMLSTAMSSLRGRRRAETEPAGSKTASLKPQNVLIYPQPFLPPSTNSLFSSFLQSSNLLCLLHTAVAHGDSECDIAWQRHLNEPLSARGGAFIQVMADSKWPSCWCCVNMRKHTDAGKVVNITLPCQE